MDKKQIVKKQWIWFAAFYSGLILAFGPLFLEPDGKFLWLSIGILQIVTLFTGLVIATVGFIFTTYYSGWWTWRKLGDPERIPFGI